jgi:hypothetical protein
MRYSQVSRCGTSSLALLQFFLTHFIISIAVLENEPPEAGLHKRATFSTLNVGLAGTGNQTQATCVAGSVARRSAIHYAFCDVLYYETFFLDYQTIDIEIDIFYSNHRIINRIVNFPLSHRLIVLCYVHQILVHN